MADTFEPSTDDDFDPRTDHPDTLPTDPNVSVETVPVGLPFGDGWSLPLVGSSTANGAPVQLLSAEVTRARALIRAIDGDVMIAGDPSRMINGFGYIIEAGSADEITSRADVYVCTPAGTTTATVAVWVERV
jgi:hypothetical protein